MTVLKSLADGHKAKETTEMTAKKEAQYVPDESDSTKTRRLAEDYDSTKNGMDYGKYQGTHSWQDAPRPGSVGKRCSGLAVDRCAGALCVTKGRTPAACVCLSVAGHQADVLRKCKQREHVLVMGIIRDAEKESKTEHVHAREEDYL